MNKKLNIFLGVLALCLTILIFNQVYGPIKEQNEIDRIDKLVIERLENIKKAQIAYKNIKGDYASDWDVLINTIKNGKYPKVRQIGDKDRDTNAVVKIDTIFVPAIEEVFYKGFDISKLALVPPMDTAKFKLETGIIEKNNIKVAVFEVSDPYPKNTKRPLKLGSMSDASTSGNWK